MIAIVQCRHHHSALEIPSLPDLKEKLVCKLFGVFVISCPAMDMKENYSVLCLLWGLLVNSIEIYVKASNIDGGFAGFWRVFRELEPLTSV